MSRWGSISRQIATAPQVVANGIRITPRSCAVVVRLPSGGFVWNRPMDVEVVSDGETRWLRVGRRSVFPAIAKGGDHVIDTVNGIASTAEQAQQQSQVVFDRILAAAHPTAVFSAPVVSGPYTVITASEVFAGGGYGFGGGSGPTQTAQANGNHVSDQPVALGSAAGGGGGSHGRPVAAIVIGPDGVKIQPIADATKIVLATMAAWGGVAMMAFRFARARKRARI